MPIVSTHSLAIQRGCQAPLEDSEPDYLPVGWAKIPADLAEPGVEPYSAFTTLKRAASSEEQSPVKRKGPRRNWKVWRSWSLNLWRKKHRGSKEGSVVAETSVAEGADVIPLRYLSLPRSSLGGEIYEALSASEMPLSSEDRARKPDGQEPEHTVQSATM